MTAARQKAAHVYTIRELFGLAKGIGLDSKGAKQMAYDLIGKDCLEDFTQSEINAVCIELAIRKDRQKRATGIITDRQLYKVREYEKLLGWSENPLRLAKFVEKDYHCASVLRLSTAQAAKLIDGLKKMYERSQREECSPTCLQPEKF